MSKKQRMNKSNIAMLSQIQAENRELKALLAATCLYHNGSYFIPGGHVVTAINRNFEITRSRDARNGGVFVSCKPLKK